MMQIGKFGLPYCAAVELATALQCLEIGQVGHAVYEIKCAIASLGLTSYVRRMTGPLAIMNNKNGWAIDHAPPEWLDILRNDPWVRMK